MENLITGIQETFLLCKREDGKLTIGEFVRGLEEFLNDLDEENNWAKGGVYGEDVSGHQHAASGYAALDEAAVQ